MVTELCVCVNSTGPALALCLFLTREAVHGAYSRTKSQKTGGAVESSALVTTKIISFSLTRRAWSPGGGAGVLALYFRPTDVYP